MVQSSAFRRTKSHIRKALAALGIHPSRILVVEDSVAPAHSSGPLPATPAEPKLVVEVKAAPPLGDPCNFKIEVEFSSGEPSKWHVMLSSLGAVGVSAEGWASSARVAFRRVLDEMALASLQVKRFVAALTDVELGDG